MPKRALLLAWFGTAGIFLHGLHSTTFFDDGVVDKISLSHQTIFCNYSYGDYSGHGAGLATCVDNIGLPGEWVNVGKNRTFDAPLKTGVAGPSTCGKGLTNTPMFYHGNPEKATTLYGAKCACPWFIDEYKWTSPETGLLPFFDANETCNRLGRRTVLFIGDSTSQQAASTLMNALGRGGCHTQVYSALSDTLIGESLGAMNRGKRWIEWVSGFSDSLPELHDSLYPDIVILSSGGHISGNNDTTFMHVVDQVLKEIGEIRSNNPGIAIVWKTQSPGTCTMDIKSPQNATEAFDTSPDWHFRWNYNRFRDRDLILLSKLQERGLPYLDMRPLYSRSDGHVSSNLAPNRQTDCLHMCIPGPLDIIARLFDRFLRELDEKDW